MTDILNIIQFVWPLVGGIIGASAWIKFYHKKERRLFKNIQRPISVIGTPDKPMDHEAELLDRVGFFNVGKPSSDGRAVDLLNGKRLAVIGYTPDSPAFKAAFNAARQREIPVIVYASPGSITKDDLILLGTYSHYSMCNAPTRLISDVFAIMSTYPEDIR